MGALGAIGRTVFVASSYSKRANLSPAAPRRQRRTSTRQRRADDESPSPIVSTPNRTSLQDGSPRAVGGRIKNPRPPPRSTESCKRRKTRAESFSKRQKVTATPRDASACSRAHNVSTLAVFTLAVSTLAAAGRFFVSAPAPRRAI